MPILPIVHMNGSGRKALLAQRLTAYHAIKAAQDALCGMAPNGRDYYVVPGLLEQAMQQHAQRIEALAEIAAQLLVCPICGGRILVGRCRGRDGVSCGLFFRVKGGA